MTAVSVGSICPVQGLFSSESVSDGHPDKICDQISDAVLDEVLRQDPNARVAVETAIKDHAVWVFGELTADAQIDVDAIAHEVLLNIGHGEGRWGLNLAALDVRASLNQQAPEIGKAVGCGTETGAGDQGMMFGYATDATTERLPEPIAWAHRIMRRHKELRAANTSLGPDAKAQVSVRYDNGHAATIEAIVLSTQHCPDISLHALREMLREEIIRPVFGDQANGARLYLNPAGPFTEGGPIADAGLTGRKIIVDSYGGFARHGGGAFSGKDGTKVDRSAAYAARQLARSIVEYGHSSSCEVRLAYAIGEARPVALHIDIEGPANQLVPDECVSPLFDLFKPAEIIDRLELTRPIFLPSAAFGHFGRPEFPWERPLAHALLGQIFPRRKCAV